jgi:hypothetical protein
MSVSLRPRTLDPADQKALARAVSLLEQPSLAARLADIAGQPIGKFLNYLPNIATNKVRDIVTASMLQSLKVAMSTLDERRGRPSGWQPKLMAGITGGVGGLFGFASLAVEIPITTTLMLRTIADIARSEGENLKKARAKLACLEVFGLSAGGSRPGTDIGYYASRAMLAQAMNEAATYIVERGVVDQAAPVLMRLVTALSARFGIVVSEMMAAGAVTILGSLGAATVNIVFMDHFQNVALGHFTVRRLERKYGVEMIRSLYSGAAARLAAPKGPRLLAAPRS